MRKHTDGYIYFDKYNIPPKSDFAQYQKQLPTYALRIHGPFSVKTLEGVMTCENGWLALDSQGNPYPIEDSIFRETYKGVQSNNE